MLGTKKHLAIIPDTPLVPLQLLTNIRENRMLYKLYQDYCNLIHGYYKLPKLFSLCLFALQDSQYKLDHTNQALR